jgi:hypothetical protein
MSCEHSSSNLNKIEGEQKADPLQTLKTLMTKSTLKTLSPMQGVFFFKYYGLKSLANFWIFF